MALRRTLAIHVGSLFELDARLWRAWAERRLHTTGPWSPDCELERDVLLVASGPARPDAPEQYNALYFVGVLRGAEPTSSRTAVAFSALERFPVPVRASERDGWKAIGQTTNRGTTHLLRAGAAAPILADAERAARGESRARASEPPRTAVASVAGESQFHRVHMEDGDGNWLTAWVPLDANARLAASLPGPWLVKAQFNGSDWYGELVPGSGKWQTICWGQSGADSLTDLATAPIKVGRAVVLHDDKNTRALAWRYVVRDVRRV